VSSAPASGISTEAQKWLDLHNTERAKRGANPLVWNEAAAAAAKTWASKCTWEHSQGAVGKFGENLAMTTSSNTADPAWAVNMWNAESAKYDPSNPTFSSETGHWTQVVWKSTTGLGCAMVQCATITGLGRGGTMAVCEYSPPGNMLGAFAQNVQL